ncbi:MAG: phytoene synthase [Methylophagaceae bacterium]|jgi:phytoene synthase
MTPDQYCQNKTAQSGSSFYYSFLFLSEPQRQAITALYAFCREIDDIVDEVLEVDIARTKLDWWRQEIERVYLNQASHPIGKALTTAISGYDLHQEYLIEIIDGMAMDLTQFSYPDFTQLTLYCHRVAGVVGLLSAEIFGYRDQATLQYAESLGMALQLTNIIRDVREDAERGRLYLPQDEMSQFGVDVDSVLALKSSPELISLLKFQKDRAQEYYLKAMAILPNTDRYSQRTGLVMAKIYQATLEEIAEDNFQVMQHRVSLTPLRKFWIAWTTTRKQRRWKVKPA